MIYRILVYYTQFQSLQCSTKHSYKMHIFAYSKKKRILSCIYLHKNLQNRISKMNFIKNNFRSRLTDDHLNDLMKISFTNFTPNIKKPVRTKKYNFSH